MKNLPHALIELDRTLFHALFRIKWPPLDATLRLFTLAGTAGALWGFLAGAAFLLTGFAGGFSPSNLLLPWGAVAVSWTLAEGAKHLFERARPFKQHPEIEPLIKTPSSSSFPSGHSATAAAGAITLSFLYPTFAPLFVLGGLLVMLSRTYLGVHYPFDVLAGALIGTLVSALGVFALLALT